LTAEFWVASKALGEKTDQPGLARKGFDRDGSIFLVIDQSL
jgi:hypothetical protein